MMYRTIAVFFTALFLTAVTSVFGQEARDTNGEEFFGPGSGKGPKPGMMFYRFEFKPDGRMMGGYSMMGGYFRPDMAEIADSYRVKIEKVFIEAKESRMGLDKKRRDLFDKLKDQADKYRTDRKAAREIIVVIKEIDRIQKQIMDINDKAMEKIRLLNQDREKEFRAANDAWIKKIETDEKELAKYVDFIENTAMRQFSLPVNMNDNPPPPPPPKD